MELIDRYVLEVRRHLPNDIRDDVSREIGSSIDDAVESRVRETGESPEQAALAVLKDFGPPKDIAGSYLPGSLCLIGPRLYRSYIRTLKICIVGAYAITLVFLFSYLVAGSVSAGLFFKALISTTGRFPFRAMIIFGVITAVYALIERFGSPRGETGEEWDPSSLPPLAGRKRVNRARMIVHCFILAGLLLLFNFARNWIGVINNYEGHWIFVPIAGGGFLRMLLWIDFYLILALALNLIVLRSDSWHIAARIFRLALTLFLGIVLYRLAMTQDLTGLLPAWYEGTSVPDEYPALFEAVLYPAISGTVKLALLASIIPVAISVAGQTIDLVRNR